MTLEILNNNKWYPFYPINQQMLAFDEIPDNRTPDEILKQEKVYGKAAIGSVGYNTAWMYGFWIRKDIRLRATGPVVKK